MRTCSDEEGDDDDREGGGGSSRDRAEEGRQAHEGSVGGVEKKGERRKGEQVHGGLPEGR